MLRNRAEAPNYRVRRLRFKILVKTRNDQVCIRKEKKMEKPPQNIQDGFLNTARKEKLLVTVYLLSGVKLTGRIRSFDKYSLILESNNQEQLVFKHAVATVVLPRTGSVSGPAPSEG